ncbi:unnamed protein product [Sphagnum balticum]
MVLLQSWVSLDIQQRLVHESQSAAHLFHHPTIAGGGKYHIYSMSWGAVSGIQKHDNMLHKGGQPLLGWMFDLAQELASNAQQHSPVYQLGSVFTPDVALVNFYLVKAKELRVEGLGGHQDLDNYLDMPVAHKILCPETHAPKMITGRHDCSVDICGVGHLMKTSKVLGLSPKLIQLQESCLNDNPSCRPSAQNVLQELTSLQQLGRILLT